MRPEEFKSRSQLAKEYRINFLGPIQPNRWPQNLSILFADIQSLGEKKFDGYCHSLAVDSVDKPWRLQTKQRAERLSALAEGCRKDRLNESGWRYRIEPEVLHRFTIEVACPRCRSRLWRSEIEVTVGTAYKKAESLEERRKKRAQNHPRDECDHNVYNRGLNLLFADRAEAKINHNPPLPGVTLRASGKYSEEPDRVYGLKQTDTLRMLLDSADKREATKSLRETLECSPFSQEPEPLLFPFLILEAKSGKVGDSAAVEMQTAFCIRRLLKVQHDLKLATKEESSWEAGPLVWFLAWYGESWSVSAGFIGLEGLDIHYNIIDLWTGNIRSQNGALQLLLIVDYIFDWARDLYRQSIIDELDILAGRDSILVDPDVYSTLEREPSVLTKLSQERRGSITCSDSEYPHDNEFLNIIHPEGIIRDASVTESRFLALHIRDVDVENFLLSFSSVEKSQVAVRTMAGLLENSWRVTAETLLALESRWTGEFRPQPETYDPNETFYVKIVLNTFVTTDWEPVRQLTYLGISEAACGMLWSNEPLEQLGIRDQPVVDKFVLDSFLDQLMNWSILANLKAALSMVSLGSSCSRLVKRVPRHLLLSQRTESYIVGFRAESFPSALEVVTSVYEAHKIGRRLPVDPYLLFSKAQIKQSRDISRSNNRDTTIRWPRSEPLFLHMNGCILVDGFHHHANAPKRCLYTVEKPYSATDAKELVENLSQDGQYYKILQYGPSFGTKEYYQHLNKRPEPDGFWQDKEESSTSIQDWIRFLETQHPQSVAGTRPTSPICISSSGESSDEDEVMANTEVAFGL